MKLLGLGVCSMSEGGRGREDRRGRGGKGEGKREGVGTGGLMKLLE